MAQSQACCQPGEAAGGSSRSVAVLTDNPSQCPKSPDILNGIPPPCRH